MGGPLLLPVSSRCDGGGSSKFMLCIDGFDGEGDGRFSCRRPMADRESRIDLFLMSDV